MHDYDGKDILFKNANRPASRTICCKMKKGLDLVYKSILDEDEVLEYASRTPGQRVQWKHPDQPVLVAFDRS